MAVGVYLFHQLGRYGVVRCGDYADDVHKIRRFYSYPQTLCAHTFCWLLCLCKDLVCGGLIVHCRVYRVAGSFKSPCTDIYLLEDGVYRVGNGLLLNLKSSYPL